MSEPTTNAGHEPGDHHSYSSPVCSVCGVYGYLTLSIEPQRVPEQAIEVHVNDGSGHDTAMAWSEGHTAGYEEGLAARAEGPLTVEALAKALRRLGIKSEDSLVDFDRDAVALLAALAPNAPVEGT